MKRLLRKKELIDALGVAKSTVADWVVEFAVYIPTTKEGAVVYYLPEAIDVLKAIKELREQGYAKPDIMRLLGEKGFPITVEEAIQDLKNVLEQASPRDNLLKVMEVMGQAMVQISEQSEQLNRHKERIEIQDGRLDGQDGRLDGQDGRMTELEKIVTNLQQELATTREELTSVKSRRWWKPWIK